MVQAGGAKEHSSECSLIPGADVRYRQGRFYRQSTIDESGQATFRRASVRLALVGSRRTCMRNRLFVLFCGSGMLVPQCLEFVVVCDDRWLATKCRCGDP